MAYMPGGSLQDLLDAGEKPDAEQVAADLLRALAHIHAAGIMHRDVKPGNVLFDGAGRACLTRLRRRPAAGRDRDHPDRADPGHRPLHGAGALAGRGRERADRPVRARRAARAMPGRRRLRTPDRAHRAAERGEPRAPARSAEAALDLLEPESLPARGAAPSLAEEEPSAAIVAAPTARAGPAASRAGCRSPRLAWWRSSLASRWRARSAATRRIRPPSRRRRPSGEHRRRRRVGRGFRRAIRRAGTGLAVRGRRPRRPPADTGARPGRPQQPGFALINQGDYEEAIPLLQQSVDGFESSGSTGDINYAYALYNLGNALRLAGRPGGGDPDPRAAPQDPEPARARSPRSWRRREADAAQKS